MRPVIGLAISVMNVSLACYERASLEHGSLYVRCNHQWRLSYLKVVNCHDVHSCREIPFPVRWSKTNLEDRSLIYCGEPRSASYSAAVWSAQLQAYEPTLSNNSTMKLIRQKSSCFSCCCLLNKDMGSTKMHALCVFLKDSLELVEYSRVSLEFVLYNAFYNKRGSEVILFKSKLIYVPKCT